MRPPPASRACQRAAGQPHQLVAGWPRAPGKAATPPENGDRPVAGRPRERLGQPPDQRRRRLGGHAGQHQRELVLVQPADAVVAAHAARQALRRPAAARGRPRRRRGGRCSRPARPGRRPTPQGSSRCAWPAPARARACPGSRGGWAGRSAGHGCRRRRRRCSTAVTPRPPVRPARPPGGPAPARPESLTPSATMQPRPRRALTSGSSARSSSSRAPGPAPAACRGPRPAYRTSSAPSSLSA